MRPSARASRESDTDRNRAKPQAQIITRRWRDPQATRNTTADTRVRAHLYGLSMGPRTRTPARAAPQGRLQTQVDPINPPFKLTRAKLH